MGIENDLKRIADALEKLVEQNSNISTINLTSAEVEATLPAKRGRPAKVETPAAPAAPVEPETPTAPVAPTEKITEQALREELRQFIVRHETKGKNKGMEAAVDLLNKYNAKSVNTIKPTDYAAIVAFCREDKKKYDASLAVKK